MPPPEPAELTELERLVREAPTPVQVQVPCEVELAGRRLPVYVLSLGNPAPEAPAVGFFGGVHGLERIGASVVLHFLRSVLMRLRWDGVLQRQLESLRMVFMPVVNPGGLWRGTRANLAGVDLMRNAPVQASGRVLPLVGGQRLSRHLPWFRGMRHACMQPESTALCGVVETELLRHRFSIAVDCHSGFGLVDRVWFPWAHSCTPIAHLPEMHALCEILDQSQPHHHYLMEPQSRRYLAHGDLWDHLYAQACTDPQRVLLPLTLEMGSWHWVRRSPRQLLSTQGLFNPLSPHRKERVLSRHLGWLDFIARAAASHRAWQPVGAAARERQRQLALRRWYGS